MTCPLSEPSIKPISSLLTNKRHSCVKQKDVSSLTRDQNARPTFSSLECRVVCLLTKNEEGGMGHLSLSRYFRTQFLCGSKVSKKVRCCMLTPRLDLVEVIKYVNMASITASRFIWPTLLQTRCQYGICFLSPYPPSLLLQSS